MQIVNWKNELEQKWGGLRFGDVKVETTGEQHIFEVQVYHDDIDLDAVRVELYANGINGTAPVKVEMKRVRQLVAANGYAFRASVPASRPVADCTARLVPRFEGVATPLEESHILWQR